jgi:hypothetical protein
MGGVKYEKLVYHNGPSFPHNQSGLEDVEENAVADSLNLAGRYASPKWTRRASRKEDALGRFFDQVRIKFKPE